jgi:hypothetical protein
MSERHLKLTIFEARSRFLHRGYWSDWKLEIVNDLDGAQWCEEIVSGRIRRTQSAMFTEFVFGTETDVAHQIRAMRYGITV